MAEYSVNFNLICFSHFNELLEISLRGTLLSSAGAAGLIADNMPNIVELDVSMCLLPSWEAVGKITMQLSRLQSLNVRYVQLS
jgi:hypothetical protein